ncbi:hypothetical protein F2Q69_00056643, partial [Brassica cretica]
SEKASASRKKDGDDEARVASISRNHKLEYATRINAPWQLAFYTGPTVGGLLNATCGNATELIIAILALANNKVAVVKYSLLGSILSNLLLVLGSSLFCGGIANIRREQRFDRKQADVNFFLLLMGLLCHLLPLLLKYAATGEASASLINKMSLSLSRTSSIVMLIAYIAYLIFQLWTHRQLFEAREDDEDDAYNDEVTVEETPVIGFWSGFAWLAGMTLVIALLSEYVVATIEKQADVNFFLLLMGLLCHLLPLLLKYAATGEASASLINKMSLSLSRTSSIVMLIAYIAYLIFQLWTHRQLFEAREDDEDDAYNDEVTVEETPVIGFWSGFAWLAGMTLVIALLSEYVVATIEDASDSWGLSVSFISIILLPIVGNAAEHAGAIIFAFKNKLDISLGVALGSATQISLFVVPLSVIVAWIMGIKMDLNFNTLETSCLALGIIITAFTLQDGTSHYMKGLVLMLCYVIIAACFFVDQIPQPKGTGLGMQPKNSVGGGFVSA